MKEKFEDIELDLTEDAIIAAYDITAHKTFGPSSISMYSEKKGDSSDRGKVEEAFLAASLNDGICTAIEDAILREELKDMENSE